MGAFQSDFFGHPGDITGLVLQMIIEVQRVEIVARFA